MAFIEKLYFSQLLLSLCSNSEEKMIFVFLLIKIPFSTFAFCQAPFFDKEEKESINSKKRSARRTFLQRNVALLLPLRNQHLSRWLALWRQNFSNLKTAWRYTLGIFNYTIKVINYKRIERCTHLALETSLLYSFL